MPVGGGDASPYQMIKKGFISAIDVYRSWISPFLPPRCRFYPSCSNYASTCLTKYSLARGIWLSIKRLLRCHPYCDGGLDPIP